MSKLRAIFEEQKRLLKESQNLDFLTMTPEEMEEKLMDLVEEEYWEDLGFGSGLFFSHSYALEMSDDEKLYSHEGRTYLNDAYANPSHYAILPTYTGSDGRNWFDERVMVKKADVKRLIPDITMHWFDRNEIDDVWGEFVAAAKSVGISKLPFTKSAAIEFENGPWGQVHKVSNGYLILMIDAD